MTALPVIIERSDDETLYSWIYRLAQANGFTLLRSFVNAYISPNATESEKSRKVLKYDLLEEYESIYKILSIKEDKQKLFLSTSLFPYYSIFMTADQQAAIIDEAFFNNSNDNYASVTHTKMTSSLQLCPDCMKEDKNKYGHFYYHRIHQLSYVSVCAKHGCNLVAYSGKQMHELDDNPKTSEIEDASHGIAFAKYSAELLNADLDANAETLKAAILKALTDQYEGDFKIVLSAFTDFTGEHVKSNEFKKLWQQIHSQEYLDPGNTTQLLMFLFPTVDNLKRMLPSSIPSAEFKKTLQADNCTMISKYRSSIVELQHSCGWIFSINSKEFVANWICPNCSFEIFTVLQPEKLVVSERTEEVFKQEIQDLTGDEYTLVGHYTDMKHTVTIRHNKCGRVQKYKPAAFLDGARCKYCNQFLNQKQLEQLVKSLSNNEYQITAKRSNNLYTITNIKTGLSKDLSANKILGELRRPTDSPILPLKQRGKDIIFARGRNDVWNWIQLNCPHGLPIFKEDIQIEGMTDIKLKRALSSLVKIKNVLKMIQPGIYQYADDESIDSETIIRERYLVRRGHHIGYPTGSNALYYFDIIHQKPTEFRLATNKETSTNLTGRTTKFLGFKFRLKGSPVEIDDNNWKILMLLDTVVNLRKYLDGEDPHNAYQILADYVRTNKITPEDFSKYQGKYAFSYKAVRELFKEEYAQTNITKD